MKMNRPNELILVLGIDGSGKSTMLTKLQSQLGYRVMEATSTPEAKQFKQKHAGRPIDTDFVLRRRQLFHDINSKLECTISPQLEESSVATSGLRLVTDVSHNAMLRIVGGERLSTEQVVTDWAESGTVKPDKVILLHAPLNVIRNRIAERQKAGITGEEMTGFNSPFFLGQYQDALYEAVDALSGHTPGLKIDTSLHTAAELVDLYRTI